MELHVQDPQANGAEPLDSDAQLLGQVQELAAHWRQVAQSLTDELEHAEAQQTKYDGIVAMLTGESKSKKKKGGRSKEAAVDPGKHGWVVSDERVEFVYNRFKELARELEGGLITPTQLSDMTKGISGETARKAFDAMREREMIRLAGSTRGGGKLYALMPEDESDATTT